MPLPLQCDSVFLDDDPRSGRPSEVKNEETIEKCEKIIDENRRITVEELSACLHVSVSVGSAHALIHELGFHSTRCPPGSSHSHDFSLQR